MNAYADLAGKVVLVTGASKALGAETARAFAAHGAKVVVSGRDESGIAAVVTAITDAGGEALGCAADCTRSADLERLRDRIQERFGAPQIVAAFAGGGGPSKPVADVGEEEWTALLALNLTSKFLTVKTFLPGMRGGGAFILMASSAGRGVSRAQLAYAAAEAGVINLTQNLAQQLGPAGIRINALAPSAVRNEKMSRHMPEDQLHQLAASFPLRRIGEPRDVAAATLFLASEASGWITGATLDLSGGRA